LKSFKKKQVCKSTFFLDPTLLFNIFAQDW